MVALKNQREEAKELWAKGSMLRSTPEATMLNEVGFIARCEAYISIIDMDYDSLMAALE